MGVRVETVARKCISGHSALRTTNYRTNPNFLVLAIGLLMFALAQEMQANVVGYVNVPLTNGYNFLENPLNVTSGTNGTVNNSITNVLRVVPDGTEVFLWDTTNQAFTPPSIYSAASSNWSINYLLPVGRGFVLLANTVWTN